MNIYLHAFSSEIVSKSKNKIYVKKKKNATNWYFIFFCIFFFYWQELTPAFSIGLPQLHTLATLRRLSEQCHLD